MYWFCAELEFRTTVAGEDGLVAESSFVLIAADTEEGAHAKAREIGLSNQTTYLNGDGEEVRWTFIEVLDLQRIDADAPGDGVEVFSRLRRTDSE
jgi:hypothetical protein